MSDSAGSEASGELFLPASQFRSSEVGSSSSSIAMADCIRDAVMCMLRRTDLNLPDLTRYLSAHFPNIPSDWRVPIVVATFSAAQKVAATYVKAELGGDTDRTAYAKRAMSRWVHGLSAVEPGRPKSSSDGPRMTSENSSTSRQYSPTTNYLVYRCLPVSFQSSYQRQQLDRDLYEAGSRMPRCSPQKASPVGGLQTSVAVERVVPDVVLENLSSTPAVGDEHVIQRLIADDVASAGDDNDNTDVGVDNASSRRLMTELDKGVDHSSEPRKPDADPDHTDAIIENSALTATVDTVTDANDSSCPQPKIVMCGVTEVQSTEIAVSSPNKDITLSTAVDIRPVTEVTDRDCAVECFFDEIMGAFDDGGEMMVNSLPAPLSLLRTPVHNTQFGEETVLCLHPSPNPALEESATPTTVAHVKSPDRVLEQSKSERKHGSPKKKILSSIVTRPESRKENVRRSSDDGDSRSRKRAKDSNSTSLSNDKSRDDDRPRFKIPLKPSQDGSSRQSSDFGRQSLYVMDRSTDRDKDWCRRDDRHRPSSSNRHHLPWSRSDEPSRRQPSSTHRLDFLSEEQRQWLRQMPPSWRR